VIGNIDAPRNPDIFVTGYIVEEAGHGSCSPGPARKSAMQAY
jgi:hypothetical protein